MRMLGMWSAEVVAEYIQLRNIPLFYDEERTVDIFTSGVKVPIGLRRSIVKHRNQLALWMKQSDTRVCPSPKKHKRRGWRSAGPGRKVCLLCLQIDASISTDEKVAS